MRAAEIERKTTETHIKAKLNIDGAGKYNINTPAGFFNHMLELLTKHANFNLDIDASGDTHIDYHHLVEDTAIVLGNAIEKSIGDCFGIERYASISLPMDETLVNVSLDVSGRPFFVYNANSLKKDKVGDFDTELVEDFFRALSTYAKITLHINVEYGTNTHHIIEAMFKGVARVFRKALAITSNDIPSTKGVI